MLNGRQFHSVMYHHAPAEARDSISSHGLMPGDPYDPNYHEDRSQAPVGVYMAQSRFDADHTSVGHDLWRVDVRGMHTREDPDDPDQYWGFHYTPNTVTPDRLKLVKKAG